MRALFLLTILLCGGCASSANVEAARAIRFEHTASGNWHYVVVLPDEAAWLEVVWCLVPPVGSGTNAAAPYAFAVRGVFADAKRIMAVNSGQDAVGEERLGIPVALARQIVDLANREDVEPEERRSWADHFFRRGLLPKLWQIDLASFGQ